MKKIRLIRLLVFLSCMFPIVNESESLRTANGSEKPLQAEKTIVLTTIFPESMPLFSEMSGLYSEAFRRMGYRFKLISQPGERALIDANQGIVDGEAGRIISIDAKKYANLIRVPHPILVMKDGAYSTDHSIHVNGWESLRGTTYRVGLLKGIKSVEQKLPLYVDKTNILTLSDSEQCMKLLLAKRIDLFIVGTQIESSIFMQSGDYEKVKLVGILETKVIYPWLHKRHKELVSDLAETMRLMKSEGWFDKLL